MSKIFLLAFFTLALAVPARAELRAGQDIGSIATGSGAAGTVTDWRALGGDKERDYDGGSAFGAQWLHQMSENVGLGLDFEWSGFGHRDHTLTNYVVRTGGEGFDLEATARYAFLAKRRWHPYITAGLGVGSQHVWALTTPRAGVTWAGGTRETRTNWDTTLTGASGTLGLGVEGELTPQTTIGLDLRLHTLSADKTVVDGALGGTRDFSDNGGASLLLRVGWRFGGADGVELLK